MASLVGTVLAGASLVLAYLSWRYPVGRKSAETYPPELAGEPRVPAVLSTEDEREVWPRPAQLPADTATFTGREVELAALLAVMSEPDQISAVAITAIGGMGGVGKTALAVHAAHLLADRFPDGQVFIDLKGFTEQEVPVESSDALGRLLSDLGVPSARIPPDVEARVGLWRSVLAGRRMLILLDNAATAAQVMPLLPGVAGCRVLVTSRRRLAGLPVTGEVTLDTLPVSDAVALFTHVVGHERLAGQPPGVVTEAVELCGRLPLAIGIAAGMLRSHLAWTVADLVARLRDEGERLAELHDGTGGVMIAMEVSYRHLEPDLRRLYRLIGLHPGPDMDAYAAAALAGITLGRARRMLDRLFDERLLLEPATGRFVFHDLVRTHAAGVAATEPASARRAAMLRLLGYYLHTAAVATAILYPHDRDHQPRVPVPATDVPHLLDQAQASRWLDRETPNVLAGAQHAADQGWPEPALHLSAILHRYLYIRRRYRDAEALHRRALDLARDRGDHKAEVRALNSLGDMYRWQHPLDRASDLYQQALDLARANGDHRGELNARFGLGIVRCRLGNHVRGGEDLRCALDIARTIGDRRGELSALDALGELHRLECRYEQAGELHRQALDIARAIGDRHGERFALDNLAAMYRLLGRYEQADDLYQQALENARVTGDRYGEQAALAGLGTVHLMQGRHEQAGDLYQQALSVARANSDRLGELHILVSLGDLHRLRGRNEHSNDVLQQALQYTHTARDHNGQFEVLLGLGRLQRDSGRLDTALKHFGEALDLATGLGQLGDQARVHDSIARTHLALQHPEQARDHWQQALDILTASSGVDQFLDPEVSTVAIRAHLAEIQRSHAREFNVGY